MLVLTDSEPCQDDYSEHFESLVYTFPLQARKEDSGLASTKLELSIVKERKIFKVLNSEDHEGLLSHDMSFAITESSRSVYEAKHGDFESSAENLDTDLFM